MDFKDKRIVYELELAGRASYTEIGKKVGLSKETTNNRVKALERKGIISGYSTIINIAQLGYLGYAIFCRLQNINDEKKQELIQDLQINDHVYWIAFLGGNYDLCFAIQARSIIEFNQIYGQIQNKYHNYLRDNIISMRAQVSQFRRKYLLSQKSVESAPYFGKEIKEIAIDSDDKKMLNILSANARINIIELAEKLHIARTTIHNKINRLEKLGIIQCYTSLIHPEKYGYQVYQLMIVTNTIDEQIKRKMYAFCMEHPNITFYAGAVGKWNFELTAEVANQQELQTLLSDLRTAFKDIIVNVEIILTFNYFVKYKLYAG